MVPFQFSKKSNFKGSICISREPSSPSYRIYFMIGPLNLTIVYLLRVLLIRSTKTMIKIKRLQKKVGPKYSSAPKFSSAQIFVGPKYSSAQNIRRQNIRRRKFSSPLVWTDNVCIFLPIIHKVKLNSRKRLSFLKFHHI